MVDNVGTVYLDVKLNDKPVSGQIKSASKGWTSMFGKIGLAAGIALGARAAVGFAKSSIQLGSAITEVQNVVDVTFGQMTSSINQWAKNASTAYGLSELNAKKYVGTMGAMLKSSGITGGAVGQMSTDLVGLSADMASFYNLDHDTAFQKIRSGISGETEPLKQLGINMSIANIEAFAMSKGITASYRAMDQASQAQLRYQYLLSVTADQQGDFARTSDSWANQTRILTNQWESFKASFGQGLINLFTPILRGINKVMAGLVTLGNVFSKFTGALFGKQDMGTVAVQSVDAAAGMGELADETKKAGKAAKGALAGYDMLNVLSSGSSDSGAGGNVTDGMTGGWGDFNQKIEPEVDTGKVEAAAGKLKKIMSNIGSFWADALRSPFNTIKSWVQSSFVPPLKKTIGVAGQGMMDIFAQSGEVVKTIFGDIWASWNSHLPGVLESFGGIWASINSMAQTSMTAVFQIATDLWSDIGVFWAEHGQSMVDGIFGVFTSIWEIINQVFTEWIKPVFESAVSGLKDFWDEHLRGMVQELMSFIGKLVNGITTIWNSFVAPLLGFLIDNLAPVFKSVWGTIGEVISSVFGTISGVVKGIMKVFGGVIDFIAGVFSGDWKRAWNGIKDIFGGVFDVMKNIVVGVVDFIETAFTGVKNVIVSLFSSIGNIIKVPINGIIELLNGAIRGLNKIKVPDWVPLVGGSGINIPQIPKLAQGGIVSQPTLAMVGDNKRSSEVIAPLHTLMGMLQQAQGGGNAEMIRLLTELVMLMRSLQFPTEFNMDGRKTGEIMLEPLEEVARRRGRSWVRA